MPLLAVWLAAETVNGNAAHPKPQQADAVVGSRRRVCACRHLPFALPQTPPAALKPEAKAGMRQHRLVEVLDESEALLTFLLFGCEVFVCEAFMLHLSDDKFHLVYRV